MSNAENKYGFTIGFLIVLTLNVAVYIAAHIIFYNRPDQTFRASSQHSSLHHIAYLCLLLELAFFGLVQYVYVLPLAYWQSLKDHHKVVCGMLTSSFLVVGANCFSSWLILN